MSDSLKDYAASTFGTAIQRIKNPAFGAFSLSWCAFNWKQLLYLFLSNTPVLDKIEYISTHSTWKTVIGYPIVSSIILCGFIPWANLVISKWQVKPLDNTDSINNQREAKMLQRSTRLQRLKAKRDITYKKVTTGEEKVIQDMKEDIIKSQKSMGELTAELTAKNDEISNLRKELKRAADKNSTLDGTVVQLTKDNINLSDKYDALINTFNNYKENINRPRAIDAGGWGNGSQLKGLIFPTDGSVSNNSGNGIADKAYRAADSFLHNSNKNKKD